MNDGDIIWISAYDPYYNGLVARKTIYRSALRPAIERGIVEIVTEARANELNMKIAGKPSIWWEP